ncbi:MAG TPA: tetratricopeptide repeat protein [Bryobacteraceae bacterium]|jgi:tetratricopeptide (TPR) repeat protein
MKYCKLAMLPLFLLVLASCSRDPKVQAQRYLDNGNKFFNRGKFREASIMYRRALQKDKLFGEAYYRLALTDLKLSAYGDAARMLRISVDLQPSNTDAITKLADLFVAASLQDAKNSGQAIKEVKDLTDKLIAQNPRSYDAHRILGQIAFLSKDYPTAAKELAIANEVNPLQTDVVQTYFLTLANMNQFPDAEKLARQMIAKDKTFSTMYDLLYVYYVRQNRLDDAEQVYKLKAANNPTNANFMLQLASHYYMVKRRDDMEAVMQRLTDDKQFPGGRLMVGDFFFFRLREYARAQKEYEAALVALPKDKVTFQKRLVELFATTGNNAGANELLATLLKDNPKDGEALEMRAALMLSTGNRDQVLQAANDLQSLVTKTPENHILRFNYARALIAKGDLAGGQLQLEEAVKLRPDFVVARELLSRVYLAQGDNGKALKAAEDTLGYSKDNLSAHLVRSSALLGIGDEAKAREELDFITKAFPQNVEARYQVGFLAWRQHDLKKAEQVFGELYKAYPADRRGLVGVVETLASEGRMPDAIKEMQKAVTADPSRRDLKLALANLEVRDEKYEQAIQSYQELLQTEPKSADLLFKVAETYRRKGDINQAINGFRQCSQAAPTDTSCLLQLGLLMDGTGRRDQAQPVYEQILKIQPDNSVALNNLAYMKAESGQDLDTALQMAQRARQKVPNSPDIADTLGWIYIKKNLSEDAVRVFKDLVVQQPANPAYHYHFGMALLQKGDKSSAKREFETAMKNNPNKDDGAKIKQLLQSL